MNSKQLISRNIELFYNKASEETRLDKGMGVFEFERIKSLIEKYIPFPNCKIVDVGGGTGKYSEWLAKKGHEVHLIEPVPKHIKIAQNRTDTLKNKFSVSLGKAQLLKFPSNFADIVILHGPLYHLQEKEERGKAISEARRVLKKDGIVLGFAISYTASTLVGLLNGLIHKSPFFKMCVEELSTGIHNPPDDFPWLLAEAFYHRPEGLKTEFVKNGLTYINIHAIEGMAWLDKDFFASLNDTSKKETLMQLIQITENDEYLMPFSPHMMIAAKK